MGKIYLLPNTLGDTELNSVIPQGVLEKIRSLTIFATENIKNTRRYLKKIDRSIVIDELTFFELNEHTKPKDIETILVQLKNNDIGIISEAGCPGIADPGAELVALAHKHNYEVTPLVGPSSILLALISSGFNGQSFSFNGYLPVKNNERHRAIKNYERQSLQENRTQIFIETPYRNQKLLEEIIEILSPEAYLSIACDITTENEYIKTMKIKEWRKLKIKPILHKRPAIFSIYFSN